jgi:hypothetical protein
VPDRFCSLCQQTDSTPRHSLVGYGLADDGDRHFDCCAASGTCPDGSCQVILDAMPEGSPLTRHVRSKTVSQIGRDLNESRVKEAAK